jgi:hypothetical protein
MKLFMIVTSIVILGILVSFALGHNPFMTYAYDKSCFPF